MGSYTGLFIRLHPPSGIDCSTVDEGLRPPPGDTLGDVGVTHRMEDMLSPMKNIDCCGFNWSRGLGFCSGQRGEYQWLLTDHWPATMAMRLNYSLQNSRLGAPWKPQIQRQQRMLISVSCCCQQASFRWCVMGCVLRRAVGVQGLTSVSPVDISSGAVPVLSPATFSKGEYHCPANVFCGLYNRGMIPTALQQFFPQIIK